MNGVDLHEAEHHTAVEALRSSGATVSMTVLRERMVEPENAITTTPLRPEDDYFPRERRSSGIAFNMETSPSGPRQRLSTCLIRNDKGLGFSIAGGKGSTPYRTGDMVRWANTHITQTCLVIRVGKHLFPLPTCGKWQSFRAFQYCEVMSRGLTFSHCTPTYLMISSN